MCLSVDGYGKTNEYIRSGSTWSIVDKHIRDYATPMWYYIVVLYKYTTY